MSDRSVYESGAPQFRALGAVRALAKVLAGDLDGVVQFRHFTAILKELVEADEVGFWLYEDGRDGQRVEAILLGLGPGAHENASRFLAEAVFPKFAIVSPSLEVPWEASGRVLGQIEARGSRRRGGFDVDDDWILRAAGELAGSVLLPKWRAVRNRPQFGLSRREEMVASLVARGYTNARVAKELSISPATVASHVAHILSKLGFRSRVQIAAWVAGENAIRELRSPS